MGVPVPVINANAPGLELPCLDTLQEVLQEWLILKIADGDLDIPVLDEIDLTVLSQRYR